MPPVDNANYASLQHIFWRLAPHGTAGVVRAIGSGQNSKDVIRHAMIDGDVIA